MPRWRPPAEKATAIITPDGHAQLKNELDRLWRILRPEVVRALAAAAAEGDRSENAEYTYRKKQLGEIDRRVRYLTRRIPALRVVRERPADPGAVYFGAWVHLEAENGTDHHVRIVGPDEIDPRKGWISIDSPLARAALKRRVDESFHAELPMGRCEFVVLAISYDGPIR